MLYRHSVEDRVDASPDCQVEKSSTVAVSPFLYFSSFLLAHRLQSILPRNKEPVSSFSSLLLSKFAPMKETALSLIPPIGYDIVFFSQWWVNFNVSLPWGNNRIYHLPLLKRFLGLESDWVSWGGVYIWTFSGTLKSESQSQTRTYFKYRPERSGSSWYNSWMLESIKLLYPKSLTKFLIFM